MVGPARLFAAVWPPPEVVERVAALPRPSTAGLRWTRPATWHVTLRFYGDALAGDLAEQLAAAAATAPVDAALGPATARLGRRVLIVPVAGLEGLAAALGPREQPYVGHLTLARGAVPGRLVGLPVEGRWKVREIVLNASVGGRYEAAARYPLRG